MQHEISKKDLLFALVLMVMLVIGLWGTSGTGLRLGSQVLAAGIPQVTGNDNETSPVFSPGTGTRTAVPAALSGNAAAGQVTFWKNTNTLSGDNDFWWDNVNKRLGIGTTTPTRKLEVLNSSVYGIAIYGEGSSTGVGGHSNGGYGVSGDSIDSYGVFGHSASSYGVVGQSDSGKAGLFQGNVDVTGYLTSYGVVGQSDSGYGVVGDSKTNYGVYGKSDSSYIGGVCGYNTSSGLGVYGYSVNGNGVLGESTGPSSGVYGTNNGSGNGVYGNNSGNGPGVYGTSSSGNGVSGSSNGSNSGVFGTNNGSGNGVYGNNTGSGPGVYGKSVNGAGVLGQAGAGDNGVEGWNTSNGNGVYGHSDSGYGVLGESKSGDGVYGKSGGSSDSGVHGDNASNGYGVYGSSSAGTGVYGQNVRTGNYGSLGTSYYAGDFHGNVYASGNVGIGVQTATQKLDVDGNARITGVVTTSKVTYSTARTHYLSISPADFTPKNQSVGYSKDSPGVGDVSIGGDMMAPVHLPDGAIVTGFKVFFNDSSSLDVIVNLNRVNLKSGGYESMAYIGSEGISGFGNKIAPGISSSTIDNQNYGYLVLAEWEGTAFMTVPSGKRAVIGAVITYSIIEAE